MVDYQSVSYLNHYVNYTTKYKYSENLNSDNEHASLPQQQKKKEFYRNYI